jgi:hypothetical protein
LSISITRLGRVEGPGGTWSVSVVRTVYKRGVRVDARLEWGPAFVSDDAVQAVALAAVQRLQELAREEEA